MTVTGVLLAGMSWGQGASSASTSDAVDAAEPTTSTVVASTSTIPAPPTQIIVRHHFADGRSAVGDAGGSQRPSTTGPRAASSAPVASAAPSTGGGTPAPAPAASSSVAPAIPAPPPVSPTTVPATKSRAS